jgi:hypothetical protein
MSLSSWSGTSFTVVGDLDDASVSSLLCRVVSFSISYLGFVSPKGVLCLASRMNLVYPFYSAESWQMLEWSALQVGASPAKDM